MKVIALILGVLATAVASELFDARLNNFWEVFKTKHNKVYADSSEEHMRRYLWEKNVEYIRRHNLESDLGLHSHRLGINEHADLTDEEYSKYLTGYVMTNRSTAPLFMPPEDDIMDAPTKVDWREEGYVTEVKNQARCGSCWAFSATGSLEGQHYKKTRKLVSLSEQNLVDCSMKEGNKGCGGGSMDHAFAYIKINGGIDTEASYPYKAKNGKCMFDMSDVGATDMGYMDIPHFDEMALQKAVATVGPISVAIDASKKDFRFYKTGVFTSMECSSKKLDHGVLVVGYGTEMDEEYWLVKNSWGKTWGDQGYIKMRRNYHNMCGIATMASYPMV